MAATATINDKLARRKKAATVKLSGKTGVKANTKQRKTITIDEEEE